jgi:hypothetical protein
MLVASIHFRVPGGVGANALAFAPGDWAAYMGVIKTCILSWGRRLAKSWMDFSRDSMSSCPLTRVRSCMRG